MTLSLKSQAFKQKYLNRRSNITFDEWLIYLNLIKNVLFEPIININYFDE
jgi:hypothetical protein